MNYTKDLDSQPCHHCGTPHKYGNTYTLDIDNSQKSMCCPGCVDIAKMLMLLKNSSQEKTSSID